MPMLFVIEMKHDSSADPTYAIRSTKDAAAERAHKFFLDQDFELRDGLPFDADGGFSCFDNVEIYKGKVIEFMHCGGDGPCLRTTKVTDVG